MKKEGKVQQERGGSGMTQEEWWVHRKCFPLGLEERKADGGTSGRGWQEIMGVHLGDLVSWLSPGNHLFR